MERKKQEKKPDHDSAYEVGYLQAPEGPELGEAQMALLEHVLTEEDWGDSAWGSPR